MDNSLLMESLGKIGCKALYDDRDFEDSVMMALRSVPFQIGGAACCLLYINAVRYPGDNQDVVMCELVNTITANMGAAPILQMTYPIDKEEKIMAASIISMLEQEEIPVDDTKGFAALLEKLDNAEFYYERWEWDVVAPEESLRKAMNDVGSPLYDYYQQSNLFGGRKIADYIDHQLTERYREAQAKREQCAGIYGLDPAWYDVPLLEDIGVVGLFFCYSAHIKDVGNGNEEEDEMEVLAIDYLKYCICQRENIPVSEPSSEHRLEVGDEFQKCFEFYMDYLNHQSNKWIMELFQALHRRENLAAFEPLDDWRG